MFVKMTARLEMRPIQMRCACGEQYAPPLAQACPACGRRVPKAVSVGGGPWITYQEHKRDNLRQMLEADELAQVPEEYRAMARRKLLRQIRELEDGSWKAEALHRIAHLKVMLDPPSHVNLDQEQRKAMSAMRSSYETQLQALKEELEDAGAPYDESATDAAPKYLSGVFTRPKVTRREWEEDPMHVVQKVAAAIALHIRPENMTPLQRATVSAWYYASAIDGGGGHGEILMNASTDDQASAKMIPEALQAIGAMAHVAVFQKAVEQWASKPRQYRKYEHGDRKKFAQWIKDVSEPVRAEFNEVNEEARRASPGAESYIIAYLKEHQAEFFEITEA